MKVKRAVVSVSDKRGLVEFCRGLAELEVEILSTSGTAQALRDAGIPVTAIEDVTGSPEMLGGRVRTLHPTIHAGVLARRDNPQDMAELEQHGVAPIDLVVCNLYPFHRLSLQRGTSAEDLLEAIDIGGVTLLRAAAKNFAGVGVVCDPDRYGFVLSELTGAAGELAPATLRELASEAFAHTAGYDATIANWFADDTGFPDRLFVELVKDRDLRYGENPHQRAAFYADRTARRHALSMVDQLGGKELSFNNIADVSAGRELVTEFTLPACVIVKHTSPCGVAVAASVEEAYARAVACDPMSAFGGVVIVNRPVSERLALTIAEQFVEVLFAPGIDDAAVAALAGKPDLRLLVNRERRLSNPGERDYRRVMGGVLVQDLDSDVEDRDRMTVVTKRSPSEKEWGDLLFAWRVVKHVGSNAITATRDLATIGIGGGQVSRLDAARVAIAKADGNLTGAAVASDAFFPFADGVEELLRAGATAIIQPGGAKRDDEVAAAVEAAGATMVVTGRRHFRH